MEYLTVSQAAERLGVDKETIRRYLRDGRLVGRKNGLTGRWVIPAAELAKLQEQERAG